MSVGVAANLQSFLIENLILERNKTSPSGFRTDQMEAPQSVAKNNDEVDRISHKNGAVADVAQENRRKFRNRSRRLLYVSSLVDDSQSSYLCHHFCVHNSPSTGVD